MTFAPGVRVQHYDNPGRQGTVLQGVSQRPSGIYRSIRWDDGHNDVWMTSWNSLKQMERLTPMTWRD